MKKRKQFELSTVIRKNHHTQLRLLAPEAGADAEPETAPETEADLLFEPCVDEEEVLTVSAGLESLHVQQPVPLPDFAVEEAVGMGVLTLTLAPFTCDSRTVICCCCCCHCC